LKQGTRQRLRRGLETALLAIVALAFAFPLLWMVKTAFSPTASIYDPAQFLPTSLTLYNFQQLAIDPYMVTYFKNSFIISSVEAVTVVVIGSFAAYSISRLRFPGRDLMAAFTLFTQMIPSVLIVIPFYLIMNSLGLLNSYLGIILADMTFILPLCMWLLRAYFSTIPAELEEAASLDGCGKIQTIFRIILPVSAPGLAAVAVIAFLLTWGELLFALTLVSNEALKPVSAALAGYSSQVYSDYGPMMAFSLLACIPPVVLFAFVLKYYVTGLTAGAVKK